MSLSFIEKNDMEQVQWSSSVPLTCTWQWRIPPLSQSSERLYSAWRCFQQRIHTQTSNWPQAQQRQSWQGEIELETALCVPANMGWSTEAHQEEPRYNLPFISCIGEWGNWYVIFDLQNYLTTRPVPVPDPSGPGYCPNRWWALERSVCSDERPSPVTKSGKKLQMRRYCVAHVMLIILGPTQHAINHHF